MTVRFKSEYQKSFRPPRSRRTSAQCCPPLAGLRSDYMGVSREPRLQRRRRFGPVGPAHSCSPLFRIPVAPRRSPSPVDRKQPDPDLPTSTGSPAEPDPRASAESKPVQRPEEGQEDPGPADGGKTAGAKPHPSRPQSQSQLSRVVPSALRALEAQNEVHLEPKARGQRSGGQKSEYHQQFSWKTPAAVDSPILTAEQAIYSSSRFIPPFKKHPLPKETEYQRSFQVLAPPTGPQLRKHREHRRTPLFHIQVQNKSKKRAESQKQSHPKSNTHETEDSRAPRKATPPPPPHSPPAPPPQVHRRHRMSTEYQSSFRSPLCEKPRGGGAIDGDAHQIRELRQQAQSYRNRAWGTHFSRDHLSQLLSEHNGLWEARATPSTPLYPSPRPPSRGPSGVEALDLASNSSQRSSGGSGGEKTMRGPPAGRRTAWGERGEEEDSEEEEGRLPTPQLKMKPVQRTHHDLTTPAKGGAILVGKLRGADDLSPCRQRCQSSVSTAATGTQPVLRSPVKEKEAWSEKVYTPQTFPSPNYRSQAKPIRAKPPPPVEAPPPQHGLHGTLRHAEFQHNGVLGLKSREAPCSGGCCSDEDERLSVMSWRSAKSCSAASVVLDRALKRREDFWGKT